MAHKSPGKAHRKGISLMELYEMFPDEDSARTWMESYIWPEGRACPRCGSIRTHEAKHAKSPYRCTDCRAYFSVKTGTAMEGSKIPLRKWVFAFYLETTSLKGISSMKLHRDIKVTQKTAWFMLHRIREVWATDKAAQFTGPVEVDETYFGGKRKNMSNAQRRELAERGAGRGADGKVAVVDIKDRETKQVRAKVVESTDKPTLQGFVVKHTAPGATVYTDEASQPTRDCRSSTRASSTASRSTYEGWRTRTARSRSGQCSSASTWAPTTSSVRSTWTATSSSSPASRTSASSTLPTSSARSPPA